MFTHYPQDMILHIGTPMKGRQNLVPRDNEITNCLRLETSQASTTSTLYAPILWLCGETPSCRVPHPGRSVIPLDTLACYIPSVTLFRGFCKRLRLVDSLRNRSLLHTPCNGLCITGMGPGPCCKPIILARAHIFLEARFEGSLNMRVPTPETRYTPKTLKLTP